MEIFREHAPSYWAANLPAIALKGGEKRPITPKWQEFCERMPTPAEQQEWVSRYPSGNIGLALGPASGLVAIDIDISDNVLVEEIKAVLPPSPWVRVGKKGCVMVHRYEGQKNFKLIMPDGSMGVELLGKGNQVVLPPSIHPDTGQPYTSNTNLWEVLDQVQPLPANVKEILAGVLGLSTTKRATTHKRGVVGVGNRHNTGVALIGSLINSGLNDDEVARKVYEWNDGLQAPLPVSEIDAMLSSVTQWDTHPFTDQGNASRLYDAYGDKLCYVPEVGVWYAWNGFKWEVDNHARN
jgi:putative DNA primase/helicase